MFFRELVLRFIAVLQRIKDVFLRLKVDWELGIPVVGRAKDIPVAGREKDMPEAGRAKDMPEAGREKGMVSGDCWSVVVRRFWKEVR